MSASIASASSPPDVSSNLVVRTSVLLYGVVAYLSFVLAFVYAMGFVGNWFVPNSIDSGAAGPIVPSLLINSGLLMVFVLQHTIMARPAFKRWFTRFVPVSIERSRAATLLLGQRCPSYPVGADASSSTML